MLENDRFRGRCRWLLLLALTGLLLVALRTAYLAVFAREKYLTLGRELASSTRDYYPPRARLLDRDGVALAWSEDYFDLHFTPGPETDRTAAAQALATVFPDSPLVEGVVRRQLSARETELAARALAAFPEFRVVLRRERLRIDDPRLRVLLGEVTVDGNRQRGISGLELQYDERLAGRPGRYEVLLDRERQWISGSWHLVRPAEPGADVRLPRSVAEYQAEAEHAQP